MPKPDTKLGEPRWPAMIAVLAVGVMYAVLPEALTVGPSWGLFPVLLVLQTGVVLSHRRGRHRTNDFVAYAILCVLTLAMIASVGLMISAVIGHKEPPKILLISAAVLWITNVIVFASWYWRLDAGGPNQRDLTGEHIDGAFLFPQMVMDAETKEAMGEVGWRPGFVDYLFLAFNTSTAFSPTDSPVLSRWAKLVMMVQSGISLTTVAVIAARAINIL